MIRKLNARDIPACAEILCLVYNNEIWQCRWERDTACRYLEDFFDSRKFIGYAAEEGGQLVGALFAREKIWWNNSEVFVEEMFVRPDLQGRGVGTALLAALEEHVREKGLAGMTLSTNRYAAAPGFYRKNGFSDAEHVLYMYKEV